MSNSHAQPLLLSIAELRELSGYRNHGPQIGWLVGNSIPYFVDSSGRPRVLRRVIEQRLGYKENGTDSDGFAISTPVEVVPRPRPNFNSLTTAMTRAKARHGS